MHKICVYCLLKARPGVLKVSLCIYLVFGFFRCYLAFFFDLAVFAYDYLVTLSSLHKRGRSRLSRFSTYSRAVQIWSDFFTSLFFNA